MKVLVAGATGAIGRPLVGELLSGGHEVAAIARTSEKAAQLCEKGVDARVADVFDARAVSATVRAMDPEVVICQLTALPSRLDLRKYRKGLAPTNRVRREATPNLVAAAGAAGARRVIVQSTSFITAPTGSWVHDETAPTFDDAPKQFRDMVLACVEMERKTLAARDLEPVVLRYGFFYGPGTYNAPEGGNAIQIRSRKLPIVGRGTGVTSFVHVADAATATIAALNGGAPGVYNVTDDDPAKAGDWLPIAASALGAKPPMRVPVTLARLAAGAHGVHFATTLRGNSNKRFKETFGWAPSRPSWRTGLPEVLNRRRHG